MRRNAGMKFLPVPHEPSRVLVPEVLPAATAPELEGDFAVEPGVYARPPEALGLLVDIYG